MKTVLRHKILDFWLIAQRDRAAVQRIVARIDHLIIGNKNGAESVGEGISELRIPNDADHRLYFINQGEEKPPVLLCCGDDKNDRPTHIKKAKEMADEYHARRRGDKNFSSYDSADYLETQDDVIGYLAAVTEEGGHDAAYVSRALGVAARIRNFSEFASKTGMSRQGLIVALSGESNPRFATIMKVIETLGLKMEFHSLPHQPEKIPSPFAGLEH